ncbi:hypothetical protein C8J56DRAFT_1066156 [Mycena floridula]|nr:hypothetical protein C8J56DRAFT_1066156 [Mycena floridula]
MSADPTTPLTPLPGHTDLISNAWLMSYNLAINTVHRLWICIPCQVAFFTSSVAEHTGKAKPHLIDDEAGPVPAAPFIAALALQNNIATHYPDTTHAIPAVDGLQVHQVTHCSGCRWFGVRKTIVNHILKDHKKETLKPTPQGTYNA